jgi:hypothetical protein
MAPGVVSVGVVADKERLIAETDAALQGAPVELSEALESKFGEQAAQVTSWSQVMGDGVDIISVCLLPQWHLTDKERARVSEKLARMLDLLVPIRMSPVVEAVVGVVLTTGAIAASRAIMSGGRLPPFGPVKSAEKPAQEPAKADPMTLTSLTP